MKRASILLLTFCAVAVLGQAQEYGQLFVASYGADTASCGGRLMPCLSFQVANAHTGGNGGNVIQALDSGIFADYKKDQATSVGTNQAITIDGTSAGAVANCASMGGTTGAEVLRGFNFNSFPGGTCNGVTIGGTSPVLLDNVKIQVESLYDAIDITSTGSVTLRNVVIVGTSFLNGINITGASSVVMENVTIQGTGFINGIVITSNASVSLKNVTITGSNFAQGVLQQGGTLSAENLTVTNAKYHDLWVDAGTATIRDSAFRGSEWGIYVGQGNPASVLIDRTDLSFNSVGLEANGGAGTTIARVSNSVITGNNTGIRQSFGGQILSFRTNMLVGNTTDGETLPSVALK